MTGNIIVKIFGKLNYFLYYCSKYDNMIPLLNIFTVSFYRSIVLSFFCHPVVLPVSVLHAVPCQFLEQELVIVPAGRVYFFVFRDMPQVCILSG